jgi:hypothetical protein
LVTEILLITVTDCIIIVKKVHIFVTEEGDIISALFHRAQKILVRT